MAVGTFTLYKANLDNLNVKEANDATVKVALISSSYSPNAAVTGHSVWSNVSANQIATGNGYTSGGYELTSKGIASTSTTAGTGWKFTSENPAWTASVSNIPAWKYAVFYATTGEIGDQSNMLLGYFLGDDTLPEVPATTPGNTLTLNMPANGWFDVVTP